VEEWRANKWRKEEDGYTSGGSSNDKVEKGEARREEEDGYTSGGSSNDEVSSKIFYLVSSNNFSSFILFLLF